MGLSEMLGPVYFLVTDVLQELTDCVGEGFKGFLPERMRRRNAAVIPRPNTDVNTTK